MEILEFGHRKRRDDAIMYLEDPDDGAGAAGVFKSLPRRPGMPLLLLLLLMLTLLLYADAREDDLQQRPTKSKPKPSKARPKSAGSSPSPFPRTKNATSPATPRPKGKAPIAPELWPLVTSIAAPTTRAHMVRAVRLLQSGRCHHVYIDVGTNIGVQVRKLYEPHRYPLAHTLPLFDAYFGPANTNTTTADTDTTAVNTTAPSGVGRGDVCTFAFEPNPRWSSALTQLEQAYKRRGWAVVVFSGTAVYTDTFHGRDLPFYPQVALSI